MKPNMNAIIQYKNKVMSIIIQLSDLKTRESDLKTTTDKLNQAKQVFDYVKQRRYNEFMEGFNTISAKLKEMYQVRSSKIADH